MEQQPDHVTKSEVSTSGPTEIDGVSKPTHKERTMTEKGRSYAITLCEKELKHLNRQLKAKCEHIEHLLSVSSDSRCVHKEYSVWLSSYEPFLSQYGKYVPLLHPDEEDKYEQHITKLKVFKTAVENWFTSQGTRDSRDSDIRPSDSVSNITHRSSHKSHSSRSSSVRSSISSARLKADQKMAELKAKEKAFEAKRQLELERLNLRLKEEELQIKTEIEITRARSHVLEQYENQNIGSGIKRGTHKNVEQDVRYSDLKSTDMHLNKKHAVSNTTQTNDIIVNKPETIRKHVDVNPSQVDMHVQLNPNSKPFVSKHKCVDAVNPCYANDFHSGRPLLTGPQEVSVDAQVIHSVVRQLRKPPPEIQKISGDPLQYRKFMRQFEVQIVANSETLDELMNHLEQLTCGEARKIVSEYSYLSSEEGYYSAKAELEERYGNPEVIANAFIKRALNWPIKVDNSKSLDEFAIFLNECQNAVRSIHAMKILEYSENLKMLVGKLPYYCQDRWRSIVQQHRQRGQVVEFCHLVRFVKEEAQKANDPVFGRDALRPSVQGIQKQQKSSRPQNNTRSAFFVKDEEQNTQSIEKIENETKKRSAFSKPCLFCKGEEHSLVNCDVISKRPLEEINKFLKSSGLCYGCLRYGHHKADCRRRATCDKCKRLHPTICHRDDVTFRPKQAPISKTITNSSTVLTSNMGAGSNEEECTMAIVPVVVKLKDGLKCVTTHAFLDPGSSVTFCTEDLMHQLGGHGTKLNITLNTIGDAYTMDTYAINGLQIGSLLSDEMIDLPKTYTMKTVPVSTSLIPTQEDAQQWSHLQDVQIPTLKGGIGLLIGNNVPNAYAPLDIRTGPSGSPHAIKSRIGWILWNVLRSNRNSTEKTENGFIVNRVEMSAIQELDELKKLDLLVRHSINMDFPERTSDDKKEHSQEDKIFLQKVNESMKSENGHYHIGLPFRDDTVQLPNNRYQAIQRLNSLERKLRKDKNLHGEYTKFMLDLLDKGYAEEVPENELQRKDGKVWYLPHHNVIHPKKPEKVRIVFDCAASFQGISLNSQLLQGPDLTNYLISVLLRFRVGKVAIMADIEAMFHQVFVIKNHTDCLRFLFWKNGDLSKPPTTYRMLVHLFGATSSPSCANAALKQAAIDNRDNYEKIITDVINNNFYVDDCLASVDTDAEATKLVEEATDLCSRGGFHLTKWTSSSTAVLQKIEAEERAKAVKSISLDRDDLPVERALGVQWKLDSDSLGFNITTRNYIATRRGILSAVSTIYDPLGIASPFVLQAKIILQQLCNRSIDWDTPISDIEEKKWKQWLSDLPNLQYLQLRRCYKPQHFGKIVSSQLHYFSDASDKGYGIVCYIRQRDDSGNVCCAFLLAKSRVAPLKKVTIPRLELTAATLSVRLSQLIKRELVHSGLGEYSSFYWTDSMAVLNYIGNDSTRFQTFVANRLTIIRDASTKDQWNYVDTKVNPADVASRGQSATDMLQNQSWLCGPDFLYLSEDKWIKPKLMPTVDLEDHDPVVAVTITSSDPRIMERLLTRFSSWTKLRRITARILTAFKSLKKRVTASEATKSMIMQKENDPMKQQVLIEKEILRMKQKRLSDRRNQAEQLQVTSVVQLRESERAIIRYVQNHNFPDEISALEKGTRVSKSSPLYRLDPFMQNGFIHVGGRLTRADIPYLSRHPIALPKTSPVSYLILRETHRLVGHLGRNSILADVRQKYWIIGAATMVKQIVSKCVHCRKCSSPKATQKMADLPSERLETNTAPFTNIGMDYFGPFTIKRGRTTLKRYGVIFTCLVTRAVHLEVAHTLDADSCLNAIRRFIARRGKPSIIRSDNGTNLVASERILKEEINKLNHQKIKGVLAAKQIQWEFNPPTASHFGGIWERLIRSVRKVMNAILHEQTIKLDDEGLQTLLCEVESILNGRPITEAPNQPNDLEALTPNHLPMLRKGEDTPPGIFNKEDNYAKRRWRQVQFLADTFWRRWVKQYLPLLQERSKWQSSHKNIAEGDIVLVVDESPRNAWRLGRVIKTFMDKKGFVRSVQLKTQHGILCRPIHKLCQILEADIVEV